MTTSVGLEGAMRHAADMLPDLYLTRINIGTDASDDTGTLLTQGELPQCNHDIPEIDFNGSHEGFDVLRFSELSSTKRSVKSSPGEEIRQSKGSFRLLALCSSGS